MGPGYVMARGRSSIGFWGGGAGDGCRGAVKEGEEGGAAGLVLFFFVFAGELLLLLLLLALGVWLG